MSNSGDMPFIIPRPSDCNGELGLYPSLLLFRKQPLTIHILFTSFDLFSSTRRVWFYKNQFLSIHLNWTEQIIYLPFVLREHCLWSLWVIWHYWSWKVVLFVSMIWCWIPLWKTTWWERSFRFLSQSLLPSVRKMYFLITYFLQCYLNNHEFLFSCASIHYSACPK